jgi:hypothetical protein
MKDQRLGDCLWDQWQGDCYEPKNGSELVYFTQDHIDIDHEIVKRALASALQRDGIVDSLGDGFRLVESAETEWGWAGILEDELEFIVCSEDGETPYGDLVVGPSPVTWVEFLAF